MNEHRDRDKRKQHLVTKKIRRNETTNVLITVQHATPSNNWRRMDEVNMFCFETKTTHVQFLAISIFVLSLVETLEILS